MFDSLQHDSMIKIPIAKLKQISHVDADINHK